MHAICHMSAMGVTEKILLAFDPMAQPSPRGVFR